MYLALPQYVMSHWCSGLCGHYLLLTNYIQKDVGSNPPWYFLASLQFNSPEIACKLYKVQVNSPIAIIIHLTRFTANNIDSPNIQ